MLCLALGIAIASHNVQADSASDSSKESSSGQTLEEVTVTAQRRAENIESVPISIAAYTQADLDLRNISSLGDVAGETPGVNFRPVGYENWVTIRGIAQNAGGGVAGLGPNTTAIYIDDAPIQARYANAAVSTTNPMVFDIDHIEVLRGPQGTLFGASAEGGAIRLISREPSLTDYSGYARTGASFIDNGGINDEAGVAYGGPIVQDQLGFRVSMWTRHDGGYIDNVSGIYGGVNQPNVNKADNYVGQAALLWKPDSAFSAEVRFYISRRDQNSADFFNPLVGNPSEGDYVSWRALLQPIKDDIATPSLKLNYDFGWSALTSVTSYIHRADAQGYDYTTVLPPAFGFPVPTTLDYAEPTVVGTTQNNFTEEVRLQSPGTGERFRWLAGLYYSKLNQHDFETVQAEGFPAEILQNTGQTIEQFLGSGLVNGYSYISDQLFGDTEKAIFGHLEYDITDHFTAIAAVRYEDQNSDYRTVSNGPLVGGFSDQSETADSHVTAPKAGLNWKIDANTLAYISAAKGYRPGGVNIPVHLTTPECTAQLATLGDTDQYKPDYLWSYEVGFKSLLFDRHLAIEGSVYHINWDNIISAIHVPACATHVSSNLGDAKSDGFDLSIKALLNEHWSVGLYTGYTDARYTSDTTIFGGVLARSGQAISDISPWNLTGEIQYQAPIRDRIEWYAFVQDRYNSKNNRITPAQDPTNDSYDPSVTTDPSVNQLDARIGLRIANGVDVSIFGENLLNAHPLLNEYLGLIDITSGAFTIQPRTVGVSLIYHW
jgi:outer membrane receptor protein involved in Fe transport